MKSTVPIELPNINPNSENQATRKKYVDDLVKTLEGVGTEVAFDKNRIYGTESSPITGNLTETNVGAELGITVGIIHNSGTLPTIPATWKRLASSFNYVVGVNNYFIVQRYNDNTKFYSIVQKDIDSENIEVVDNQVTIGANPKPLNITTLEGFMNVAAYRHASSAGSGPMPIRVITQAAYTALNPKDANTLYLTY